MTRSGARYCWPIGARWVRRKLLCGGLALLLGTAACGSSSDEPAGQAGSDREAAAVDGGGTTAGAAGPSTSKPAPATTAAPTTAPLPDAGNAGGGAAVPPEAEAVDTSRPDQVIGDGSPDGCTSAAVVDAVARGGIITFDCGPEPVTITMEATAKVRNDADPDVVLDGGGLVTLSGGGERRILYMNTCDEAQAWTTSHCDDQDHPRLAVQDLTFADGDATGDTTDGGGGGAIFVRGGRLKVVGSTFLRNRCDPTGPDVGGAAVRVLDQSGDAPVHIVGSTFGGAPGEGGSCANGGALSSIGVSWVILNSVMTHNEATGSGANPAEAGTPGGGSGGALYADGNRFTVRIAGSRIEANHANEGGGAVFFVSNDRSGTLTIEGSTLAGNPSDGFETEGFPGIFFLGARDPEVVDSTLS